MDANKKISFGFSKTAKDSIRAKAIKTDEKKEVQYVDTFDGSKGIFSFKGSERLNEPKKRELVIPLTGTKNAYEVIKEKLEEKEKIEEAKPTLDELAANEILNELKGSKGESYTTTGLVIKKDDIPLNLEGKEQSTLEDYENVPIGEFGLAMLRGMGWTPKTGIGKDQKVVEPVITKIRPKRLGLGADNLVKKAPNGEEDLPLKKGGFIKVVGGPHKGQYGVVQSLDPDCAQVFVTLNIGDFTLSEHVVETVTKNEFFRNIKEEEQSESNLGKSVDDRRNLKEGKTDEKRHRDERIESIEKKRKSKDYKKKKSKHKKSKKSRYSSSESNDDNFKRKRK